MDTIFALSSGSLPSGIAVIRVTGPYVKNILQKFVGFIPKPRYMNFCKLYSLNGEILDKSLVVYFSKPKSYTGEDCLEFHLHGSKALVNRFLSELSSINECRLAEAGEFSRRSFLNGKIDLTEAEGIADLIRSETESQRRLSMIGASGNLKNLYNNWKNSLIRIRAKIEAQLDFSDEEDVSSSFSFEEIQENLKILEFEILQHIKDSECVGIIRDGLKVVISGTPNSGKSSFINLLSGKKVSIVSDILGTTRDSIETRIVVEGLPVTIIDTAGLRKTEDAIEQTGINIAISHIQEADLVLVLQDVSEHLQNNLDFPETSAIIWKIGNKIDIKKSKENKFLMQLSVKTGEGWDFFLKKFNDFCKEKTIKLGSLIPARIRQVKLLKNVLKELKFALQQPSSNLELCSERLRYASNYFGYITGDINPNDILDVIFSEFCIGK